MDLGDNSDPCYMQNLNNFLIIHRVHMQRPFQRYEKCFVLYFSQ